MKMVRFSIPVLLILCCWVICFSSTVDANDAETKPLNPKPKPKPKPKSSLGNSDNVPIKSVITAKEKKDILDRLNVLEKDLKKEKEKNQLLAEEIAKIKTKNSEQVNPPKGQLKESADDVKQKDLLEKLKQLEMTVQKHEKILPSLSRQVQENVVPSGEIQRTCADLFATDFSIPSGMQWIDPDGQGVGERPIYVYCNMTAKGSTSILHDSGDPIEVGHCARPGCYSRSINYKAPMAQIKALADLSSECHQSITYDCYYAPYKFGNTVYSWWNDRDGNSQYFWSGNNEGGIHTCQCGIDGNCADSTVMCNCDSLAPQQLTDSGVITRKNILPITRLNFGRTQLPTSSGIHKLGNLTCSGYSRHPGHPTKPPGQVGGTTPATPALMPTSCDDLKKMGYILSGFFSIKGPRMMESVYCNFTKLPTDAGFQKLIGYIDVKSAPTYFYVQRNKMFNEINTPITFNSALVNAGNAMSLSSGKFKALVKGTYFFSFAGLAFSPACSDACLSSYNVKNEFGLQVSLYKNGERIGLGSVQDSSVAGNQWSPVTFQSTLNLKKGDTVWVQISYLSSGAYLHDDNFHHTHFTGFILREEIVDSLI